MGAGLGVLLEVVSVDISAVGSSCVDGVGVVCVSGMGGGCVWDEDWAGRWVVDDGLDGDVCCGRGVVVF